MKNIIVIVLSLLCVGTITAAKHTRHSVKIANDEACWQVAKQTLKATNVFRAKKGLPKLVWNQKVAEIARKHSVAMGMKKVEFGHDGFEKRVDNYPKFSRASAENVYMANYKGDIAQIAVDSWVKSPGHLKNIVGDYNTCGIGVYQNSEGYWYFTQLFASF